MSIFDRCPTCDAPAPHLHPAVQFEGEVQPCGDDYHRRVVGQNTPERIADVECLLEITSGHRPHLHVLVRGGS